MSGFLHTAAIDKISTREAERLRPANPDRVLMIAASIRKRGQLQPIGVYRAPNEENGAKHWVLAFGLHRLQACQHLGMADIEIKEVAAPDARHAEIEENLFRADLTALDRAISVGELRKLHEAEHGVVTRGGDQSAKSALWSDEVVEIAEKVGLSKRSIENADRISRDIPEKLREALRGTTAEDNQSLLLKIAAMKPVRQLKILRGVTEERMSVADAVAATEPKEDRQQCQHELTLSRMLTAWKSATAETQDAFLKRIKAKREAADVA